MHPQGSLSHDNRRSQHMGGIPTAHDILWSERWTMPVLTGLTLEGYSRGGDITCFCVKELHLILDAGLSRARS